MIHSENCTLFDKELSFDQLQYVRNCRHFNCDFWFVIRNLGHGRDKKEKPLINLAGFKFRGHDSYRQKT